MTSELKTQAGCFKCKHLTCICEEQKYRTGRDCSNCKTGKEMYDGKEWFCDSCNYLNNTGEARGTQRGYF